MKHGVEHENALPDVRERVSAALGNDDAPTAVEDQPSNEPGATTVLLADAHRSGRRTSRRWLEQHGFKVVAEASTASEAIALTEERSPQVCLIDLDLAGSGTTAIAEIRQRLPRCFVAALTSSRAPSDVVEAVRAGADGYLLKGEAPTSLVVALRALSRGEIVLPRGLTGALFAEVRRSAPVLQQPAERSRGPSWLLYAPRFARHYRHRRQAGMTIQQAADRARDRMHDYH